MSVSNATASKPQLLGWVDESPGRGTWSIITSCFFTIFICTWTVIHPRIHTVRQIARLHKPAQLVKTLLAPELVCLESLQEWIQARKMVQQTAAVTGGGLKFVHAFYIGMMGLRYRTPQGHRVLWPRQYIWLLKNDLVRWSDADQWGLSKQMIMDKSKADDFKKLTALCQVTWFVCQCITRVAHNLDVAPLEAMTLAYIFIVLITYLFWWVKPKDIRTATIVNLPLMRPEQMKEFEGLAMENVYDDEGPKMEYPKSIAWYLITRDCDEINVQDENRKVHDVEKMTRASSGSLKPASDASQDNPELNQSVDEARPGMDLPLREAHVGKRLTKRSTTKVSLSELLQDSDVITQWDRSLYYSRYWPLVCILGAAFGALHLMSWNSTFPTTVERWIWRSSALVSIVTSIVSMQFETMSFRWDGPLTVVRVVSPILYVISRFLTMAEVLASLRAMPRGVYETYVVSNYWFHFL